MLIKKPRELAKALYPLLDSQVVVRYAADRGHNSIRYTAELALLVYSKGTEYLVHWNTFVLAGGCAHAESSFTLADLDEDPDAIDKMCARWANRSFDDWLYDKPFAGALDVFRESQPYTPVKLDASHDLWRLLTGVILGEIWGMKEPDSLARKAVGMLTHRFGAFAAQTEHAWARSKFITN